MGTYLAHISFGQQRVKIFWCSGSYMVYTDTKSRIRNNQAKPDLHLTPARKYQLEMEAGKCSSFNILYVDRDLLLLKMKNET